MAGYVKMWTTLRNNVGFLALSCNARGAYMQLILAAKEQRDDGTVCYRNVAALGADWGCDRATSAKILRKLSDNSLCTYTQNGQGVLTIKVANYMKWQELTVREIVENSKKSPREITPLRPDQTKPDQTIPYQEVVEHLNLLSGKAYRHTSGNTQRYIRIRWDEGFRLDDFMYVNQIKAEEWLGTEREKYLRPETLYGTKFEGYRQQRRIPRQYSEKTNKALVAAALFLKNKGVSLETSGLTPIDSSNAEITVGIHQRD